MIIDTKKQAWMIKMGKMAVEFMMSPTYKYLMETYDVEPSVWFMNQSDEYQEQTCQISISVGDVHFSFDKFFSGDKELDNLIMIMSRCYKLDNYENEDYISVGHFRLSDIEEYIMMEMVDITEIRNEKNNEKDLEQQK